MNHHPHSPLLSGHKRYPPHPPRMDKGQTVSTVLSVDNTGIGATTWATFSCSLALFVPIPDVPLHVAYDGVNIALGKDHNCILSSVQSV
jgi:hypothetical protein